MIDITKFSNEDASDIEKNLYAKFQQKQQRVFDTISTKLNGSNPPAYKDEDGETQEYLSYICNDLLRDTLGIISKDAIDTSDATYKAWTTDETIIFVKDSLLIKHQADFLSGNCIFLQHVFVKELGKSSICTEIVDNICCQCLINFLRIQILSFR